MSDEHTKPQPAIRTFAQDLATAREKRNQSATDDSLPVITKNEEKKPKKVGPHFSAQAPQKTSHVDAVPKKETPKVKNQTPIESVTETNQTTHSLTKIPAFHELQDKAITDADAKQKSDSKNVVPRITTKKHTEPKRSSIGYDATVITDKKNQRFNLFQSVSKSLQDWFSALSFFKKKKTRVYSVPDTQRRKGVIQKATSKSGSIFTSDSAGLRAKIKQRQKLAAAKEDGADDSEISWSPFTDPGYALIESPKAPHETSAPHNVAVEFKQQTRVPDTNTDSTPQIPSVPQEPLTPPAPSAINESVLEENTEKAADSKALRREATPKKNISEVKSETEPEPATEPVTKASTSPIIKPSVVTPKKESSQPTKSTTGFQSLNTNTLAIAIVAGLSAIILIFFLARAFVEYIRSVEPVVSSDTTSYLQTSTPNPVVMTQINSITDIPLQAGQLLDIAYVDTQLLAQNKEIIPPSIIIDALGFRLLPSFTQSLSDIRFAQKNASKPIIIFEFTDTDTVLGGFLSWEDTMAEDLREVYLITQTNNTEFVDRTIAGKDIRVLQSSTGETLAVYGLVAADTALITATEEMFVEVLNTSFSN